LREPDLADDTFLVTLGFGLEAAALEVGLRLVVFLVVGIFVRPFDFLGIFLKDLMFNVLIMS